ncbi:CynX/NimT family MFS transporter [Streptomyces sp. NBC_01537]|uniref:CynX/NimT family MFS transporter n=1 Tax=Streptomyces sp. NBC_01537 TaxID=2903896 RepID=UPI00386A70AB
MRDAKTTSEAVKEAVPLKSAHARIRGPLVVAAVLLAALNLRPAITSLGAVLEEARDGLGMSGAVAGLLTSVPVLCFAAFGIAAPRLARRFGPAAVICAAMAVIALGLTLRPLAGGTPVFLAASVVALAGIAVTNVLMPVIVKRYFPDRVGPMTGIYSMALTAGAALGSAATVPVARAAGGSWRIGLGAWAVVAVVAILPWLALARDRVRGGATGAAPAPAVRITRSRTAWALAVFFGLQATSAYVVMGWLPQIFRDAGVAAGTAGLLSAVAAGMGVPLSFVLPALAGRMRHQGLLAVALGLFGLAGYGGLWLAPAAAPLLWAVLLGVTNATFPLALTMIGMRSRTGSGVVRLSAFTQCTGYLIAFPGPILVGALYQHSGGWGLPIGLMVAILLPQTVAGVLAGRSRFVED